MKVTILGSGTSGGVPQVGCRCRTCRSTDPRDKRLRTSAIIETDDDKHILIDCGPDFREQFLRYQQSLSSTSKLIDAIILTHHHYDHIGGLDDLRPVSLFSMPIYAEEHCIEQLIARLPYCFTPPEKRYLGVPTLDLRPFSLHEPLCIGNTKIIPFRVMHGKLPITGFRIGDLTYITDMSSLPPGEMQYVEGTKILICNALHHRHHPSHMTTEESVDFAQKVGAEETYFIHMSHYCLPHAEEDSLLPPHIHLAYDGMVLNI